MKRLPTMQETRVQSLGQEDLLEKGMATHSSILASPAPQKRGSKKYLGFPGGSDGKAPAFNVGDLDSIPGLGRPPEGGHSNPLQYSCLENSHERRLVGYSSWGFKESDTTELLSTFISIINISLLVIVKEDS